MSGKADMTAPDLRDPAQRRAYRRELMGVARTERYWGIFLAMVGIALLWMRRSGWWTVPEWLAPVAAIRRSEEHTSELQSLMRTSYAFFCLKKKIPKKYDFQVLLHLQSLTPRVRNLIYLNDSVLFITPYT